MHTHAHTHSETLFDSGDCVCVCVCVCVWANQEAGSPLMQIYNCADNQMWEATGEIGFTIICLTVQQDNITKYSSTL